MSERTDRARKNYRDGNYTDEDIEAIIAALDAVWEEAAKEADASADLAKAMSDFSGYRVASSIADRCRARAAAMREEPR